MWSDQSFYTEPEEREGCACSCCRQAKIGCAIGWGGVTPIEAIGWQAHHWTQMAWSKTAATEARLYLETYTTATVKDIDSQFQFFQRHLFLLVTSSFPIKFVAFKHQDTVLNHFQLKPQLRSTVLWFKFTDNASSFFLRKLLRWVLISISQSLRRELCLRKDDPRWG